MRRLITMVLTSAVALVATPGAQGVPTVSLTARASHVYGFFNTGNIVGAGASLELTIHISGNEYGGYPPPLTHLDVLLPPGMRWDSHGFPDCRWNGEPELGPHELVICPRNTQTHRSTSALMATQFGSSLVPERVQGESFYSPGGTLSFFLFGHEPVLFETVTRGAFRQRSASAQTLEMTLREVETVPGGQFATFTELPLIIGSGHPGVHGPSFSLRMPERCPHGSLHFRVVATFGGGATQTAYGRYDAPCPKKPRRVK
jgi:hypothetical protein